MITCARCGKTAPRLAAPPMAGAIGQQIQALTCEACWNEWREEQTRLINHLALRPHLADDRAKLYGALREYLKLPA